MWTPYFSIHFPPTPAGSQAGLLAYQHLRELSLQRQLSPPDELVKTTQADIDRITSKYDPVDLEEKKRRKTLKLPILGQMLPQDIRARKLMDQKATSVADVAFVLGMQSKLANPNEGWREREKRLANKGVGRSRKYRKRLQILGQQREEQEKMIAKRADLVEIVNGNEGQLRLESYAAKRISMEYQGRVIRPGEASSLKELEETKKATEEFAAVETKAEDTSKDAETGVKASQDLGEERDESSRTIKILWADMRDGTYAQEWPENVLHNELERKAVTMGEHQEISTSVHVVGAEQGVGFYTVVQESAAKAAENRKERVKLQVVGDLQDRLVGLSIRVDRGVLRAAEGQGSQKEQYVRNLAQTIDSELDALSQELDKADPAKDEDFKELREEIENLKRRVRHPEALVKEYRAEEGGIENGQGNIRPMHKYISLRRAVAKETQQPMPQVLKRTRSEISQPPEDFDESAPNLKSDEYESASAEERLAEFMEAWPEFRRYEQDVKLIEEGNKARNLEIHRLKNLLQEQEEGSDESREDLKVQIKKLRDLKWEDMQAQSRLWRDLVLGQNKKRRVTGFDVPSEEAVVVPGQSVGWFARVRRGLMRKLPFGGRREYSTSTLRLA